MTPENAFRDRPAVDWALLIARIFVGIVFTAHGAQKLFGAFGGPRRPQSLR
ncbi:MAG TPA: DoxX family protein [Blastocatellia bacterium]|nr:DoxX family protein [Blastocatellia bacterium]